MIRHALAASAALAFATPLAAQEVTMSPVEAMAGYYDALAEQVTLPVAPPGVPLDESMTLTHFAFGSCNHQSRGQHMWAQILAKNPQLFMLIGDNVYGDTNWDGDAGLGTLRAAYAEQSAHPEFQAFRAAVPMLTTWDDHDYGFNDGGGDFAFKGWAETIYETYWGVSEAVRAGPGIYESRMIGPEGRRVQVILLDTRYFRSDLARMPWSEDRPVLGPYVPEDSPKATMLGAAQWKWLKGELARPADLRILVSSIQIITEAHDYESWENMPRERERLLEMLSAREDSGLLLLTGDRHAGGIYTTKHGGETFWELTSSSLNLAFNDTASNTAREPDPMRITDLISEENFATIDIDWEAEALRLRLLGNQGETRAERTVNWGG
ncbi:MAG: alkaline phosphatase D family protein [Qipengyuania sp.]